MESYANRIIKQEEYPQIKGVLLYAGADATGFNALGNIISGAVNPSGKTVDTWVYDLTAAPTDFTRPATLYANGSYNPAEHNDANDEMPVTRARNGLQLVDLRGASYGKRFWTR